MKKFITMLLVGALTLSMVACGSKNEEQPSETVAPVESEVASEEVEKTEEVVEETEEVVEETEKANTGLKDGIYTVEAADFSESGWKDSVSIAVQNGTIVDAVWTGTNTEGKDKIEESKAGNYNMNSTLAWHEQSKLLTDKLIETQDLSAVALNADGKTDAVTGVSITVAGFVELAESAITKASDNAVANGNYKDGEYTAEAADFDQSGWKDIVTVTVENGLITNAKWTGINADGQDKYEASVAGDYNMKAAGATLDWHEQSDALCQALVETQDLSAIAINADGETDTVAGVTITVNGFITTAAAALEQAK